MDMEHGIHSRPGYASENRKGIPTTEKLVRVYLLYIYVSTAEKCDWRDMYALMVVVGFPPFTFVSTHNSDWLFVVAVISASVSSSFIRLERGVFTVEVRTT